MSAIDSVEIGAEPPSLAEQAYRSLREGIVRLDFAPGDVLREDERIAPPNQEGGKRQHEYENHQPLERHEWERNREFASKDS